MRKTTINSHSNPSPIFEMNLKQIGQAVLELHVSGKQKMRTKIFSETTHSRDPDQTYMQANTTLEESGYSQAKPPQSFLL